MTKRHLPVILSAVTAFFAAAAAHPAAAWEIYKWVDGNGVVHYSDSRPEEPPAPVEKLYIPRTNSLGYDPADDYWSVVNQAERINAGWAALREEKEEERARARAAAAEERLAELERRVAAAEAAEPARPVYAPFGFIPRHPHRFLDRGFFHRFPPHRSPPHRDRGVNDTGPRPGWSPPDGPSGAAAPGFAAPERP